MRTILKRSIVACALAVGLAPAAGAEELVSNDPIVVRAILPDALSETPGSTFRLDEAELERLVPITAKEALRRVPGFAIVDEDAFGMKLNLSVRGLNPRRSMRTLLLEDGAPIQPAPYADPSSHYHPPPERISRIDVRKGSGQILFGPQTIGGVVDFVTLPRPDDRGATASLALGLRDHRAAHLGLVGETLSLQLTAKSADGTRDGHETAIGDAVAASSLRLSPAHALTVKIQHAVEETTLSEGGLDAARFAADPFANPFRDDRFELERSAAQLVHRWRLGESAALSTMLYAADTFRASYRQADTSNDAMTANPATGCVGAARTAYETFASLCGNKMRPRRFRFAGFEPRLEARHDVFGLDADSILGVRLHVEDTTRRRFNGLTPAAREGTPGTVLRDDNRIAVEALSAYGQSTVVVGALRVTPGVRLERIETRNEARVFNFVPLGLERETRETLVLPGLGVTYAPTAAVSVFAGVHQGFAPPRPDRDVNPSAPFSNVKPERSTDAEIGVRARLHGGISIEATAFRLALEDLVVEGAQVGAAPGTFVNAGEARHEGLEVSGRFEHASGLRLSGAWTELVTARFESDADETARGVRGNRIPYAPERRIDLAIGVARGPFDAEIGLDHTSEQFADAANTRAPSADGMRGLIPERTLWRAAASYAPAGKTWRAFASVQNLTDEVYVAARTDGLFAGARRQAVIGLELRRGP